MDTAPKPMDLCKANERITALEQQLRNARTRWYPIQGETFGIRVTFDTMRAFEKQAQRNHGQSIERLAERGGLDIRELWAVVAGCRLPEILI